MENIIISDQVVNTIEIVSDNGVSVVPVIEQTTIEILGEGTQGPKGDPGPSVIDPSTLTPYNGILKGNGVNVVVATPDVDYATPALTIINAIIFG